MFRKVLRVDRVRRLLLRPRRQRLLRRLRRTRHRQLLPSKVIHVSDFWAALGLVMVFEGLVYGGFPRLAKRLAADVVGMPEQTLRTVGLIVIAAGVGVVWLVRG